MQVLVLSGSTRQASLNSRLAELVAVALPDDLVEVRHDLARLPHFDADLEATGFPPVVQELRAAVKLADLLVIATPEYNGGVPGVLANAVDWLSRPHQASPMQQREVVVVSASPSAGGGQRAAAHLRQILANCGAQVRPDGLAVPRANDVLTGKADPQLLHQLHQLAHPTTGQQASAATLGARPAAAGYREQVRASRSAGLGAA